MEWNTETKQWAIGGAIVVVLALLGWWFFTGAPVGNNNTDTTPNGAVSTSTSGANSGTTTDNRPSVDMSAGESVQADDQPAGDSARVVEARLSRVSWIAVRDDMRIYGAVRVNPPQGGGTVNDITVPLLRNTEAGKAYSVVVYADDGDGVFDFKKDSLVEGLVDTFNGLNGD